MSRITNHRLDAQVLTGLLRGLLLLVLCTVASIVSFPGSLRAEEEPAPAEEETDPKVPVNWTAHMGKLPFVVGHDLGMKEVAFTGKAPMFFFSSSKDKWCPLFAGRTFSDEKTLKMIEHYTPILIDADAKENAALEAKYTILVLPAVVWADFSGNTVFVSQGDVPLEMFRSLAEIAEDRAPERREPAEGLAALIKLRDEMLEVAESEDVQAILAAIAAIREVGLGAAIQRQADSVDAELTKNGEERIAKAKALIEKRRKSSAKRILRKVIEDYGEHPVGKRAAELLTSISK